MYSFDIYIILHQFFRSQHEKMTNMYSNVPPPIQKWTTREGDKYLQKTC